MKLLLIAVFAFCLLQVIKGDNDCQDILFANCQQNTSKHLVSGTIFKKFRKCINYDVFAHPTSKNKSESVKVKIFSSEPNVLELDLVKQVST